MIVAKNIHKYYDQLHVLKGVDISVEKKEIVSIVGASGAGKSTLLHILGTLDNFQEGHLQIDKIDIATLSKKALAKFRNDNLGFIFQFHQLLPEFTAIENVCLPAFIKKTPQKDAQNRAKELLSYLGLSNRINHKPNALSGGEQQRVAVARALINNPAYVLADEPSGNLDTKSAENLHHLFFKLRDDFGQTFIIVTHNEELAGMADRKLVMQNGQMATT